MKLFVGLNLPQSVVSALCRNGITSADALVRLNVRELGGLHGVGPKTVNVILEALDEAGLELVADPWASYVCVRHNKPMGDAGLATFLLCPDCCDKYTDDAFSGAQPEWFGAEAIEGYCAHCNESRSDISLVQWHLCGVCERVARSIGRSLAAGKYLIEIWNESIAPHVQGITLKETDLPELRPWAPRSDSNRQTLADFTGFRGDQPETAVFGFELKSGRNAVSANGGIGKPMTRFQLDTTDCDDIAAVVAREHLPMYLVHVQVFGRAHPPTERFQGVGIWWTDMWAMQSCFQVVAIRPRETKNAAYYSPGMFRDFASLTEYLSGDGHIRDRNRIKKDGQPWLYRLP